MSEKPSPDLRITVNDHIYYQQPGMDTVGFDSRYKRFIKENEQSFLRKIILSEELVPLQLASWITNHAVVAFKNDNKLPPGKLPSEEQKEELAKGIIEIFLGETDNPILISPGESARFRVKDLTKIKVKASAGKVWLRYIIIPE